MTKAEQEFHRELVRGSSRLKREISYNPTRFLQMVDDYGGVGAVQRLLHGRETSDGFTPLWAAGRLAMSCEAMVLLPWYEALFTDDQRGLARWRLTEHGFDVDGSCGGPALAHPAGLSKATHREHAWDIPRERRLAGSSSRMRWRHGFWRPDQHWSERPVRTTG
jgi:hypothetical protein